MGEFKELVVYNMNHAQEFSRFEEAVGSFDSSKFSEISPQSIFTFSKPI